MIQIFSVLKISQSAISIEDACKAKNIKKERKLQKYQMKHAHR